jgi:hypothetical protein
VQIRARFRHLVRGHQKDLSTKDLLANDPFRQWVNAYLQLTGPDRRDYDHRLRQSRGREAPDDLIGRLPEAKLLLIQAEVALVRRKLKDGIELAKEAVKRDQRNAEGYALLGDLLREQGRYDNALTMYNYAIQFEPSNRRYWQLLQEVTALREGRALPRRYRLGQAPSLFNRPPIAWFAVILTTLLVGISIVYARQDWGAPVLFSVPRNLLLVAVADGFVLGLILAGTAVIGPFDDELVWYDVAGFGTTMTPVGLFVIAPGLVFFWLAPVFYLLCAWLDDHLSLSVVLALGWCGIIAIALGLLAPAEAKNAVFALSGNVVFFGFLWGWLFGSLRKRVFEH